MNLNGQTFYFHLVVRYRSVCYTVPFIGVLQLSVHWQMVWLGQSFWPNPNPQSVDWGERKTSLLATTMLLVVCCRHTGLTAY